MTTGDSSLLRASVIYAGLEIARDRAASGRSPEETLAFIRQGDAHRNSFDYAGAFTLAGTHGWSVFVDSPDTAAAFRATLSNLIVSLRPTWVMVLPAGRAKIMAALDEDLVQCLEIAALLGYDDEAVAWWDALASLGRQWSDDERLAIGREAEKRAMARERALLAGTGREPRWVAIEDNTAGYDIETWRCTEAERGELAQHYVEVKGSSMIGFVHLSRGEWDFARKNAAAWELQIWLADDPEPVVLGFENVSPHIPGDQGEGTWERVKVATDRLVPAARLQVDTPLPQPMLPDQDLPVSPDGAQ
ncbi:MAG: DUF3883 domain-containing protein [Erythrobacter sp.]|nr:DUF3883 domain-containing protein [Erythrobacter sp.]